jgi:hypothetical protein
VRTGRVPRPMLQSLVAARANRHSARLEKTNALSGSEPGTEATRLRLREPTLPTASSDTLRPRTRTPSPVKTRVAGRTNPGLVVVTSTSDVDVDGIDSVSGGSDHDIAHVTSPVKSGKRRATTLIVEEALREQLERGEGETLHTRPTRGDIQMFKTALEKTCSPGTDLDTVLLDEDEEDASSELEDLRRLKSARLGGGKNLALLKRTRTASKPLVIKRLYFGTDVILSPWYSAPYPSEYHTPNGELWICEFCLRYMRCAATAQRHLRKCHGSPPPGDEIYRDPAANISVFEINGRDAKLYCQNLCLLAKMFLDHKTLYYDVDPFLFYVLVEWRRIPTTRRWLSSFVGYFSKEKVNPASYNVSCILTMPHHQRKGYGSFLIDFSYLLSRRERRPGTPEKPLSDLGLFSYVAYWREAVVSYLSRRLAVLGAPPLISIEEVSIGTGITVNDVLGTLEYLKMLRFDAVPDPMTPNKFRLKQSLLIDAAVIDAFRRKVAERPPLRAHDALLRWQPYTAPR